MTDDLYESPELLEMINNPPVEDTPETQEHQEEPVQEEQAVQEEQPVQEEQVQAERAKTKKWRETMRENARLKAELEAAKQARPIDASSTNPADIEALVEQKARQKLIVDAHNKICNDFVASGTKEYGTEFMDMLREVNDELGFSIGHRPDFTELLAEAGPPERIIKYLYDNPEQAAEIATMTPAKAAIKLAKIGTRFAEKAPPPKQVSKAPAPIKPTSSSSSKIPVSADKMSITDFNKAWKEKQAAKMKQKYGV